MDDRLFITPVKKQPAVQIFHALEADDLGF